MQRSNPKRWNLAGGIHRALRALALLGLLLGLLSGCASTTAPQTEAERIARAMRERGVELANLRPVKAVGRRVPIVENQGFDIPGITLKDQPAGTIRIYKDERHAEADRKVYGLLGQPGPQTKLDYVTVVGKRELILNHRLPNDLAERYIDAFTSSP